MGSAHQQLKIIFQLSEIAQVFIIITILNNLINDEYFQSQDFFNKPMF